MLMTTNETPTILLVDDCKSMRSLVMQVARVAGYENAEFLEAPNGREALAVLEEREFAVDLVLCDLNMPVMDGYQFLVTLDDRGKLKRCPVVIVASTADRRALQLGAREVVRKPFRFEDLVAALHRVLPRRHQSHPSARSTD